jgi:hypothetical protein
MERSMELLSNVPYNTGQGFHFFAAQVVCTCATLFVYADLCTSNLRCSPGNISFIY